MDGTGSLFSQLIAALDPRIEPTVVRYPNDPTMGYPQLEVVARATLPVGRPFVLLAESFSGPIAVSIAASAPGGLCALVLCCSFVRNPHPALHWLQNAVTALPVPFPPAIASWFLLGNFATKALRTTRSRP
jgi:pimeloyl-ACP methyl ester carboxylesterase